MPENKAFNSKKNHNENTSKHGPSKVIPYLSENNGISLEFLPENQRVTAIKDAEAREVSLLKFAIRQQIQKNPALKEAIEDVLNNIKYVPELSIQLLKDTHGLLDGKLEVEEYQKKAQALLQQYPKNNILPLHQGMLVLSVLVAYSALFAFFVAVATPGVGILLAAGVGIFAVTGMFAVNKTEPLPDKQQVSNSIMTLSHCFFQAKQNSADEETVEHNSHNTLDKAGCDNS